MVVSQFVEKLVRSWCFCIHFSAQKCFLHVVRLAHNPNGQEAWSGHGWISMCRKAGQVMAGARGE